MNGASAGFDDDSDEPDIVRVVLRLVAESHPSIPDDVLRAVEKDVRERYGGRRLYINKTKKRLTDQQRKAVYQDALTSASDDQITQTHGVSRRTLYRYLKKSF